jgi:hypothetical protein
MAKNVTKKSAKTKASGDLTTDEIKKITDELVVLREKLRLNGATALTPTAEWTALRKEIALLNKNLNEEIEAGNFRADLFYRINVVPIEVPPMRERVGDRVIRKRDALQAILQVLRRGETVGILIDQHITEKEGVIVPFFGRPASTAFAPALIAMRSGAAVLPIGIVREQPGQYRVLIGKEVSVRWSGDRKADLAENTARFNLAIEGFIRRYPDQWFWVHRRWKTQHPIDPRLGVGERTPTSEEGEAPSDDQ